MTSSSRGDGTFEDERPLHQGVTTPNSSDLWSVVDLTGNGRPDVVALCTGGVRVSAQDEERAFAEPLYILDDFGVDQGWSSIREHPRFAVATTRDGVSDFVGFGPQGVTVARGRGDGTFEPSQLILNDYGQAQGWTGERHPRPRRHPPRGRAR